MSVLKLWQISLLLVLAGQIFACKNSADGASELTFAAARGDFVISVEARGVLEAKKAHNVMAPMLKWTMPKIAWLPQEGAKVQKGDIVVELEAGAIENEYSNAINEVEIAKAEAQKGEAESELERVLLESQIRETAASLATSNLRLNKMKFEAPKIREIKRLEIAIDELELEKIKKKLVSIEKIQTEERMRLQLKLKQAQTKLQQARHYLNQLKLEAPVEGFVEYAMHWNGDKLQVGSQLWPNMTIVKIPDLSIMQVKLQVGETDAHKIKKGQSALVSIPSLDDLQLTGRVSKVAKMAKPIRKDRKDTKVKRVEVLVEIDSTNINLALGLTAECRITIAKMEDVVTVPLECVFDKDSVKVVYVLEESSYIPYPVRIEKYGDDFVAIKSELKGDEQCALKEPASSNVKWPESFNMPIPPTKADSLTNGITGSVKDSSSLKLSVKP